MMQNCQPQVTIFENSGNSSYQLLNLFDLGFDVGDPIYKKVFPMLDWLLSIPYEGHEFGYIAAGLSQANVQIYSV